MFAEKYRKHRRWFGWTLLLLSGATLIFVTGRAVSKRSAGRVPATATAAQHTRTATQSGSSGSISGRVVEQDSGKLLAGVSLELSRFRPSSVTSTGGTTVDRAPKGSPAVKLKVKTDNVGAFEFAALPAGEYRITATLDHYLNQEYGQSVQGGKGKLITVREAENVRTADFQLPKKSVIAGTIVDARGDPMPNLDVRVFTRTRPIAGGLWTLSVAGATRTHGDFTRLEPFSARTDHSGRYRFEDLEPDDYFIVAFGKDADFLPNRRWMDGDMTSLVKPCNESGGAEELRGETSPWASGVSREVSLPVLYPGTNDPATAKTVRAPRGGELRGINFTYRPTRSATLTGTVVRQTEQGGKAASGKTPRCFNVALLPNGPAAGFGGPPPEPPFLAIRGSDAFQFNDVMPGTYTVVAVSGPQDHALVAIEHIDVRPGAPMALTLALKPVFDLQGRFISDNRGSPFSVLERLAPELEVSGAPEISTLLSRLGYGHLLNTKPRLNRDGSFVARNVIANVPYGWMFSNRPDFAVRYGGRKTYGWDPVVPDNSQSRLDFHLDFIERDVEIAVTDEGKPWPDAVVLLLSRRLYERGVLSPYGSPYGVSNETGRIAFHNVEPGDYDVYAWEDVSTPGWVYHPHFLDPFENRSQAVRVDKAGMTKATVQIIKLERQ